MRAVILAAVALLVAGPAAPAAVRWAAPQRIGPRGAPVLVAADGRTGALAAWNTGAGAALARRAGGTFRPATVIAGARVLDAAAAAKGATAALLRTAGGLAVAGTGAPDPVPGTTDATQGRIAVDDAGHVVVVWVEPGSGTTLSIRAAVRAGAAWSPPEFVDVGAGRTFVHDLVISRGAAYLLYGVSDDGAAAEYLGSRSLASAGWTAVTLAQTGAGIGPVADLAALSDGRLAAIYVLGGRLRAAVGRDASFSRAVLAPGAGVALARPALAQDARGDLLVAYARGGRVRTARRPVHGHAWRALPSIVLHGAGAPALARLTGGDVVLAVRARTRTLAWTRRSGTRAWSARRLLAAAGATGDVALGGGRQLAVAWPAVDGVRARVASRRP